MNKFLITLLIIFVGLTTFSSAVLAQDGVVGPNSGNSVTLINPIGSDSITEIIDSIIRALRDQIAPPLLALMILVGAFQMLFAAGKPDKFENGKKTIIYSIIGYAIILIASGVSSIIRDLLST